MSAPLEDARKFHADASAQRIARVYAEALLDEAMKRGEAAEILAELEALRRDVAGADPLLANFFLGGLIGRDQRDKTLRTAFEGRASELLLNFLYAVNDHDRLDLLGPIVTSYRKLLDERTGRIRVVVRSAFPLDDEQRRRIADGIRSRVGREPELDESVDPDLIGGLVLQVGDFLYDASLRTRLGVLLNQVIERSSHEIQAGRDRFSSPV
jgi:F-type H+-transporting ATPase subunit delta